MRNRRGEFISIVIPAYNESGCILPTLSRVDEYFKNRFKSFELIVVNDGSQDNTAEVVFVLKAQEKIKSIRLIENQIQEIEIE